VRSFLEVKRILLYKKAIAAVWILLILFPNPIVVPLNIYRLFQMPTKPTDDVKTVAASLPANGSVIEQYVDEHVHYTYDFEAYGVVWYLSTPNDVLKSHQGDCKSKAVLTASLLEAKGIPYTLRVSPVHFWVDYSGRAQTNFSERYETTQVAIIDNGQFKIPSKTNAFLYLNTYKDIVWTSMPLLRKIALIGGLAIIIQFGYFAGPKKRLHTYLKETSAKLLYHT
jgi:predicted transglutaminase-like cysteine proteinase